MLRFMNPILSFFSETPAWLGDLGISQHHATMMHSQGPSQAAAMAGGAAVTTWNGALYPAPAPAPYYTPAQSTPGPLTAAQRVLMTSELVGEIMYWLLDSQGAESPGAKPTADITALARSARVNHLWFREAVRHLWSDPLRPVLRPWANPIRTMALSLPQMLAQVDESHRQYYANFVTHASLLEVQRSTVRVNNRVLRRITFPKLETVTLILDYTRPLLLLPNIHLPALKTFQIRLAAITKMNSPANFQLEFKSFPWCHRQMARNGNLPVTFRQRRLVWGLAVMLVRQIKARFGSIEAISFGPEVSVDTHILKLFEDAFPGVIFWTEHPGYLHSDTWPRQYWDWE